MAKNINRKLLFLVCLLTPLGILLYWSRSQMPWFNSTYNPYPSQIARTGVNISAPNLCIIARTYPKEYSQLYSLLIALAQNYVYLPKVYVLVTEKVISTTQVKQIVQDGNAYAGYEMASVLPITHEDAAKIQNETRDFGYSYTDAAIDYLSIHQTEHACDYFLFTNGDNFYRSRFIDNYVGPDMAEGVDLIGFDFISRYELYKARPSEGDIVDDGSNLVIHSEFKQRGIDLGAFVARSSFFYQDDTLRFIPLGAAPPLDYSVSDGRLVEALLPLISSKRMHRQVLFQHQ